MLPYWPGKPESLHFSSTQLRFAPSGDVLVAERGHVSTYASRLPNAIAEPPKKVLLQRATLGPHIDDVVAVARAVRETPVDDVIAFGGARILAAAVIGTWLGACSPIETSDLSEWLRTRDPRRNLFSTPMPDSRRPAVHVVPCTLLGVQAVPAKTWIINDPQQSATHFFSDPSLVPDHAWLSIELLEHVRGLNADTTAHYTWNRDIVATVLLESIAFPGFGTHPQAASRPLLAELRRLLTDESLQGWLNLALHSRDVENDVGPVMPALALSQALARVTAARPSRKVSGDEAVGALIGPVMLRFFGILERINSPLRAELLDLAGEVSDRAKPTWNLSELEVEAIIERAMAQTLLSKGLRSPSIQAEAREALYEVLLPFV